MSANPNRQTIPISAWPAKDRAAWEGACAPGIGFLGEPATSNWRPSTRALFVRNYGMWLSWLKSKNLLKAEDAPGDRMNRERYLAYLQYRQRLGNNAQTLVNHACALRRMLEVLAPSGDWEWMNPIIAILRSAVRPTDKHSNLPSIRELFELGLEIMRHAETWDRRLWTRAIMFRNGLAIAMLAARPLMRRHNISKIRIDEHIVREGGIYRLRFSADEMKGRRARGGPLPAVLTNAVDSYLETYRPCLLGGRHDTDRSLWISHCGLPIDPDGFSGQLGKVTEAAFGRRITMHEFRHAAASSIAKEDPEHVGIVTTINGHASYSMDERYYIIAEEHAAFKRFHAALDRIAAGEMM